MNYYAIIPLLAFLVTFFTFTYVLAQSRKNPVNNAYLFFSFFSSLFLLEMFVLWSQIEESFIIPLEKIASVTIGLTAFGFLNFTYTILKKRKDYIYYTFFTSLIISTALILSTNWYINGYSKYKWGVSLNGGILFLPIALIVFCFPCLYSLSTIYIQLKKETNKTLKKQLSLLFQGSSIVIIVAIFSDVILPGVFSIKNAIRIGIPLISIQSLLVFIAVRKHKFLSINVEEVANDLFVNLQDGIILVNKDENIIQINETAKILFHLQHSDVQNIRVSELFENYNFNENYKNYETKTTRNDKIVSLSQATVKQYNVELGKILIIRDITESKEAEEALQESKKQLENLARELRQANTSLEQKVAERTRSLQDSNQQLQQEIADRTRAEEDLADEKERLAVTLSSIGDGVITTDTTGSIVLLNAVAAQLTGWSHEHAIGTPLLDVFHIVDLKTRTPRPNPVTEVLQAHEIVKRDRPTLLIARDGNEYLIAQTVAPIRDPEGHVIGAVLVFRDVTEKQRFEEELIKAERLESVGVLAGGIAHDFNNILTAILGNISLAKMYASNDEKTITRLDNAEKAALRAQNLTQQLLTFSKGGTPVKRLSSIKELIKETVDFSLRGSNVRCDLTLPAGLWSADIDAGQISQVIHNLIINADQAMPNGGIIEVSAENRTIDAGTPEYLLTLKNGNYVKISIKDQGVGIEEERLQKIFDPYFTTKKKGSGLGLFTSYSIVKKHDGYIDVASKVGVGTTFHIYLPALQQAVTTSHRDEEETFSGKGRLLVMEDEEDLREVMGSMLTHFGYDVAFASHGSEAIAAYQDAKTAGQPFDVMILDLTIPGGMGGKETMAQLLALDPNAKAIVASGYANDPIMGEFRQYGFCGCIAKPYKGHELHQVLRDVMASSEARPTTSSTPRQYGSIDR